MIRIHNNTPIPVGFTPAYTPLLALPEELIHDILMSLPPASISECSLANKKFYQITRQENLWKQLYIRDFSYRYSTEVPASTYYDAYTNAHRVGFNLRRGIYTSSTILTWRNVLEGVKCTHVFNEKLFIGCFNGDLIIKNIVTGDILKKIDGERDTPHALDTAGKALFVGYDSGAVKAWDTETGECLMNFKKVNAAGSVVSLITCDGKLIASTSRFMINIWDIETGNLIKTLNEDNRIPTFKPHSLAVYQKHLFAGDSYGRAVIWNMETWNKVLNKISTMNFISVPFPMPNKRGVIVHFNFFDVFGTPHCSNMLIIDDLDRDQRKCFKGHEGYVLLPSFVNGKPLPINRDGKLVFEDMNHIRIWNYNIHHRGVLPEIVAQFRSNNPGKISDANNRFLRMPEKAKNKIYETLCREVYDPSRRTLNRYPNSDKDLQALYESVWKNSPPEKKAQAIIDSDPIKHEQWEGPSRCEKKQKT